MAEDADVLVNKSNVPLRSEKDEDWCFDLSNASSLKFTGI